MKILKLIEQLIKELHAISDSQNKLTDKINEINENIRGGVCQLKYDNTGICVSDRLDTISAQLGGKVNTYDLPKYINDEIDYLDRYKTMNKTNPKLLEFVNNYCNPKDKYHQLKLAEEIKDKYNLHDEK